MGLASLAQDPAESFPEAARVTPERRHQRGAVGATVDERQQRRRDLVLAVEQHLLLGRKVVEDRLARDVGGAGDVVDGHRGEAALAEPVGGRLV
jgi:hypothetical protein